jgi:hypothetical protein
MPANFAAERKSSDMVYSVCKTETAQYAVSVEAPVLYFLDI